MIITAASVREYMELNAVASTSKYSDATLGSNIRAAQGVLARMCGRVFEDETATRKFTTNGDAFIAIPGLRAVSSAPTLQGAALVVDSTYFLIPDSQQTGVHTGIQFRGFGTGTYGAGWWLGNPQWFDRNLDHPHYPTNRGLGYSSLPNDLVIPGSWGWTDALMPEPVRHHVKVLASFYTLRPDALLGGARATPDGGVIDLSQFPIEIQAFVAEWRVGSMLQIVGVSG